MKLLNNEHRLIVLEIFRSPLMLINITYQQSWWKLPMFQMRVGINEEFNTQINYVATKQELLLYLFLRNERK